MTQQSNGALIQLNNNGTFNQVISTSLPAATGIATDPNTGNLYVSTLGNNVIWNVNPTTKTQTPFVSASADGLAINAAGTILYGAAGGQILGWNTATGMQIFASGHIPGGPDGVAIGATGPLAGELFVNTNGGTPADSLALQFRTESFYPLAPASRAQYHFFLALFFLAIFAAPATHGRRAIAPPS
jgi:hypothetical protein